MPAATCTVSPGRALDAAAPILQNGRVDVPEPVSEQFASERSTESTAAAAALGLLPSSEAAARARTDTDFHPLRGMSDSHLEIDPGQVERTRPWRRPILPF